MTNRKIFVGMFGIVLTFGLVLAGCASPPEPIGDPQNPRDALGGKTFGLTHMGFRISYTFHYDGTVTITNSARRWGPFPYIFDGTNGVMYEKGRPDLIFSLISPTELKVEDGTKDGSRFKLRM
jgi:hypothetical protein